MSGITAVIITKNEEKHIVRCLDSLRDIADEVIVLDSQSTDETVALATQRGAKVIDQEWMGYSATKNHGHSMATHDYILSLDADEALSPELRKSILAVKDKMEGAYAFNRLNHYGGRPMRRCGWYPDRKVRLFPRGKARWEGEYVHETLRCDAPVTRLEGDLLHYTYEGLSDHLARANRYSDLAAEALAKSGKGMLGLKQFCSPVLRFYKMYLFQGGILAGFDGMCVSSVTAIEVYMKYAKARELRRRR